MEMAVDKNNMTKLINQTIMEKYSRNPHIFDGKLDDN